MDDIKNNKIYRREELKQYFKNGVMPNENHFAYLIDSTINKHEDGFLKDEQNGLLISTLGQSRRLISFYRTTDDLDPFFLIEKEEGQQPGLRMQPFDTGRQETGQDEKSFFFHLDGSLGIGKKASPDVKVDINGFVAMQGRTGTFKTGKIAANGKWQTILADLDNCQAFEVIARTGKKGTGRFAMMHAYAVSAFGGRHNKVRQSCAFFGFCWNKIKLRWKKGHTHNYELQLRTNSNYGAGIDVYYQIARLWSDEQFLPDEYYY
ncbi:hypothetical protein KTO58_13335 [Chitinophaga pendula]|uniref:hypothetical protein n=1 Tax=Chitinophaga TaxID=79328 RepID=UPI000BAE95AA|nr:MULTISPECIES: hypothetical protein [Chitinophaga]ASZ12277.1 hypothetical protein CK934_15565 [Chitinophaga sp. MD30]UCJ10135.1 hypothetical protein KTO58_13335 [Chitinophaga pendula]